MTMFNDYVTAIVASVFFSGTLSCSPMALAFEELSCPVAEACLPHPRLCLPASCLQRRSSIS